MLCLHALDTATLDHHCHCCLLAALHVLAMSRLSRGRHPIYEAWSPQPLLEPEQSELIVRLPHLVCPICTQKLMDPPLSTPMTPNQTIRAAAHVDDDPSFNKPTNRLQPNTRKCHRRRAVATMGAADSDGQRVEGLSIWATWHCHHGMDFYQCASELDTTARRVALSPSMRYFRTQVSTSPTPRSKWDSTRTGWCMRHALVVARRRGELRVAARAAHGNDVWASINKKWSPRLIWGINQGGSNHARLRRGSNLGISLLNTYIWFFSNNTTL